MDIVVIAISVIVVLAAIATIAGVWYVWTHDDQRRYARGSEVRAEAPGDLNWLPVESVWQALDQEKDLSRLKETPPNPKSTGSSGVTI